MLKQGSLHSGLVPRRLVLLIAGLALFACEKTSWNEVVRLPRDFRCEATLAVAPGEGLLAGSILERADKQLVHKEALIYRVRGKTAEKVFSRPGAAFFSIAAHGGVYWALLRTLDVEREEDKTFILVRSADGGASWQEVGPVPGNATQLLATGNSEVWALGARSLLRTTNGGKSWAPVTAPGKRNSVDERLVTIDDRHVGIIGGNGMMLIDRASATYKRRILPGVAVQAADGRFLVTREKDQLRIGVLDEGLTDVSELGTIDKDVAAFDLAVSGKRMWILALPQGESLPLPGGSGRGVHLFTSKNGGQDWSHSRVRSGAWYDEVDIGPDGAGIGVGYENEVWLATP